jgi:hypothetical protein
VLALFALLAIGQLAPTVTLPDERGVEHALPASGRPLLLVYEDKDGGKQNLEGKALIAAWHDPLENRARIDVWPVADLSKWDFWPARGPALKQVRALADRSRSSILVDWKAAGQHAYGFARGKSSVLLVGADGRVIYASEGDMTAAQKDALAAALHALGLRAP